MRILYIIILSYFIFSISISQSNSQYKIHGLIVGDYFYKVSGDAKPFGDTLSQYSYPMPKDFQAFQIRRLHLFFDFDLSENFFTRFQLEGNNKSFDQLGRQSLYVKTAYAEWKNIFRESNLLLGLIPTLTWASVEGIWGYRSIEKTIMDFRNLSSGSDLGVQLKGKLPIALSTNYAIMIGNGTYQRLENNKYKKYYAMLNTSPFQNFSVEAYLDYEPDQGNRYSFTWKTFLSYKEDIYMLGAEIFEHAQKNKFGANTNCVIFGISTFAWYKESEKLKVFGRIDYYNPNHLVDNIGFYEYYISFGLDFMPIKNIHLAPNIWINIFADKSNQNVEKDPDIVPRLTFFYNFN